MDFLVLPILLLVFFLLQRRILPAFLALFTGVLLCLLLGFLTPEQAVSGFSKSGLWTVVMLYVVAAGIHHTGAFNWAVPRFLGSADRGVVAYLRTVLPTGLLSAFINNTPIVSILMPLIKDWSLKQGLSPSRFLMPLSFAAILGGCVTLMGTSTNMLVADLMAQAGLDRPTLFSQAPLGVLVFLIGSAFIIVFAKILLPDHKSFESFPKSLREFVVEMTIDRKSPLVGLSIEAAHLRQLKNAFLAEIHREETVLSAVRPSEILLEGDQLLFVGTSEAVLDLQKIPGLLPVPNQTGKLSERRSDRCFAEVVVSDTSRLLGKTAKQFAFRTHFDSVIFAVSREGQRLREKVGQIVFQAGDTLIVESSPARVKEMHSGRDFYVASLVTGHSPLLHQKARLAILSLLSVIALGACGVFDLFTASFVGAALTLLFGCCSPSQALRYTELNIILSIGASFALGIAVSNTEIPSRGINALLTLIPQTRPQLALLVLLFATCVLTEFVTNNAAAALALPFALTLAKQLGVSPYPFCFGVMLCSSASFMSPLGYQTNLMVFGAGSYRVSDFLKFGAPLTCLIWLLSSFLAPVFWPF